MKVGDVVTAPWRTCTRMATDHADWDRGCYNPILLHRYIGDESGLWEEYRDALDEEARWVGVVIKVYQLTGPLRTVGVLWGDCIETLETVDNHLACGVYE